MSLTIQFQNADEAASRFGKMIDRIGYFAGVEMPREMSAWQTQDMHRKRPATKRGPWAHHQKSASTIIRPHSRYEVERSKAYQAGLLRRLRRARRVIRTHIELRRSTRPILRESLYQQFIERLSAAFYETITWKS